RSFRFERRLGDGESARLQDIDSRPSWKPWRYRRHRGKIDGLLFRQGCKDRRFKDPEGNQRASSEDAWWRSIYRRPYRAGGLELGIGGGGLCEGYSTSEARQDHW